MIYSRLFIVIYLLIPTPLFEKEMCLNLPDDELGTTGLWIKHVVCSELKLS